MSKYIRRASSYKVSRARALIRLPISDELGLVACMNVVNIHAVYRLACFSISAASKLLPNRLAFLQLAGRPRFRSNLVTAAAEVCLSFARVPLGG